MQGRNKGSHGSHDRSVSSRNYSGHGQYGRRPSRFNQSTYDQQRSYSPRHADDHDSFGQDRSRQDYGHDQNFNSRSQQDYDTQGYQDMDREMNQAWGNNEGRMNANMGRGQNRNWEQGPSHSYDNMQGSQQYGQSNWDTNRSRSYGSENRYGNSEYPSDYSQQTGEHYGKGPKGYRRSDERIREDICESLSHHGQIDASEVEVNVSEGVVTLSGTIDSRQAKRQMEEMIENHSGVQDLKNELKVESKTSEKGDGTASASGRGSQNGQTKSSSSHGRSTTATSGQKMTQQ